jgi:hypothetical protein
MPPWNPWARREGRMEERHPFSGWRGFWFRVRDARKEGSRKVPQRPREALGGFGLLAFFCNAGVSPATKTELAKEALAKGYRLQVFDLERLRSLLDGSLKDVRRRYPHIDDEPAARLRAEVSRLLRFPEATLSTSKPTTTLENLLVDKLPQRMFDFLLQQDEQLIAETPNDWLRPPRASHGVLRLP